MRWLLAAVYVLARRFRFAVLPPVNAWLHGSGPVCPNTIVRFEVRWRFRLVSLFGTNDGDWHWEGGDQPATGIGETFDTKFLTLGRKEVRVQWVRSTGERDDSAWIAVDVELHDDVVYGNYDLKIGDSDNSKTYGGSVRSAPNDLLPAAGETGFVRQMQEDLRTLGFHVAGTPDGAFGRNTQHALREFQIYAKMLFVAKVVGTGANYADNLVQVPNSQRYDGPISGVLNADTRCLLKRWVNNGWKCPVVVEAWRMSAGNRVELMASNIWHHDDHPNDDHRMFARDLSGYYNIPSSHVVDGRVTLGEYATLSGSLGGVAYSFDGEVSVPPRHCWPDREILPESLFGQTWAQMAATPGRQSTFRVVRACAEQECVGFFDSLNAYDNTFISMGFCHWILGEISLDTARNVGDGELPAYLSYVKYVEPDVFKRGFGFFGIDVTREWEQNGIGDGSALWHAQRKFVAWLKSQNDDGSFSEIRRKEVDGDYLHSWHWFHRFQMAARTLEPYRRRMWDMARIRLRDIRSVPFGNGVANVPLPAGGSRPATVGDVYTSERANALLLRWHIRFPGRLFSVTTSGGTTVTAPATRLVAAFNATSLAANSTDPSTWTNMDEEELIAGIINELPNFSNTEFSRTMNEVHDWPTWAPPNLNGYRFTLDPGIGPLATARNSFILEDVGLPVAPY